MWCYAITHFSEFFEDFQNVWGWGEYFPVSTEQGMRTSESNFRGNTRHTGAVIHRARHLVISNKILKILNYILEPVVYNFTIFNSYSATTVASNIIVKSIIFASRLQSRS